MKTGRFHTENAEDTERMKMNSPKKHQNRVTGNRKPESGAALIIVLASLIFISALTVAFLVSMRSKLALSKSGSNASEV